LKIVNLKFFHLIEMHHFIFWMIPIDNLRLIIWINLMLIPITFCLITNWVLIGVFGRIIWS
jgi:hypothetical protein